MEMARGTTGAGRVAGGDGVGCGCRACQWPGAAAQGRMPQRRSSAHLPARSEEHTSELQSLMRISYAVFCLKKKKRTNKAHNTLTILQTRRRCSSIQYQNQKL